MVSKIIGYKIIAATKNTNLGDGVCDAIESGWSPYHGPYLDRNGTEKQAMVKYEEAPLEITPESKPKKKGKVKDED